MSWGRAADMAPGVPADMTVTATSAVNPALPAALYLLCWGQRPALPAVCHGYGKTANQLRHGLVGIY